MHTEIGNTGRKALKSRRNARAYLVLLLLFVVSLALPHRSRSQTATTTAAATQALPQQIVYKQVFRTVVFLDTQADLDDQRGGNGTALRNYYQSKAVLTATETALLKSTAHSTVTAISAIDQQIQAAVIAYRGQLQGRAFNGALPPLPPELQSLQTQKDNLVLNAVATIQAAFGSTRFQNLDTFVQTYVVPHITVTSIKAPAPPAKTGPLPPMQPVPWQ
jgi:hypothetical protein